MSSIKVLDTATANQIAAGEVVERPASVVKELCENSLDAGASVISVSVQNGGILAISVIDNGTGMDREDAKVAFLRHATSKLRSLSDFDTIRTMGFRGEALASIAAVSKITLKTKQIGSPDGSIVRIEDGRIIEHGPVGCPEGTNILVEYLFYNTPARYKFLKKDTTESSYITDIIERFILARPDVSFRLNANNQEILHSPGNNDLKSAIFSVYGKIVTQALIPISFKSEHVTITGFVGKPEIARNSRQYQSVFVNRRYVKSKIVTAAVDEGYKTLLMKGKFAFCVLDLSIAPALVDVNVHPQKTEVKFWNEQEVFLAVLHSIKESLSTGTTIPEITTAHQQAPISQQGDIDKQNAIDKQNPTDKHDSFDVAANQELVNKTEQIANQGAGGKQILQKKPDYYQYPISTAVAAASNAYVFNEGVQSINGYKTPDSVTDPTASEVLAGLKIKDLSEARFIGVLFHTYLLLELEDFLILIDQHAAHERILFEKLVARHKNHSVPAQTLLAPELLELTANEIVWIRDNLELLSQVGFECEIFGAQSVVLRTVPLDRVDIDLAGAFKSVLEAMQSPVQSDEDRISNAFYSIACKAAVKAHDTLDKMEILHLLEELRQIPNSTHCPHGRPIVLKMSRYEIEKEFKRIVT